MTVELRFRDGAPAATDGDVAVTVGSTASVVDIGPLDLPGLGVVTQAVSLSGTDVLQVDLAQPPPPSDDLAVHLLVSADAAAADATLLGGSAVPLAVRVVPGEGGGWAAVATVSGTAAGTAATVTLRSGSMSQAAGAFVALSVAVLGNEVVMVVDGAVVDRRRRTGFALASPSGTAPVLGDATSGFRGLVAVLSVAAAVPETVEALAVRAFDEGLGAIDSVHDEQPSVLGDPTEGEQRYGAFRLRRFTKATAVWSAATGVHLVRGAIRDRYDALGGPLGRLGLPVAEESSLSGLLRTPKDQVGFGLRLKDMVEQVVPRLGIGREDVLDLRVRVLEPAPRPRRRLDPARGGRLRQLDGVNLRDLIASGEATIADAVVVAPERFVEHDGLARTMQTLRVGGRLGEVDAALAGPLRELIQTAAQLDVGARVVDVEGIGYLLRAPLAQRFERGIVVWSAGEGARELYSTIATYWLTLKGSDGFLGVPLGGETPVGGGTMVRFVGGTVFASPATGAHEVHGALLEKYLALGGPTGTLGFPVTDEQDLEGAPGARVSVFERGELIWSAGTGAFSLVGAIRDFYRANGGPSSYGLPLTDEMIIPGGEREVRCNEFERGLIAWNASLGAFDHLELIPAKINSGEIDDGVEFLGSDTTAELITRTWLVVDGVEVANIRVPNDGHAGRSVELPGTPIPVRLHRHLVVEVAMKAWDWDAASGDDELAEHRRTFTFDDGFFGYIPTGGSYPDMASTWDSGDASASALTFSYTFGPRFPIDVTQFRRFLWWRFGNFTTAELGWDEYADTFSDVDPDRDLLGDIGEGLGVDYYSREYAEVAKGGNCFGMSTLGVETFNHRSGYAEPLVAQVDNDGNRRAINLRQGIQKGLAYMMFRLAASAMPKAFDPREVWRQVNASTSQGTPVLVSMKGKQGDDGVGHAVVAYRCSVEGAEQWIWIADPNLPWATDNDDTHSTIRIRGDGSYVVQLGAGTYPEFDAPAHVAGTRGDRYLTWTPFSIVAGPQVTPSLGMEIACAGLAFLLSSTGGGGEVQQVGTQSGQRLYGDRRREVLERIGVEVGALRDAVTVLGTSDDEPEEGAWGQAIRANEALSFLGALTADRRQDLGSLVAALPSATVESARASWGGVSLGSVASELVADDLRERIGDPGASVTARAWPDLVEVPVEGSRGGQLLALGGRVPGDLYVEMGAGRDYDVRAYAAGSVARVRASGTGVGAGAGAGADTLWLDRFASERPGVRLSSSLTDTRQVELALSRAVGTVGREEVGWRLTLDLAADGVSELAWTIGRIGARLTRPGGAPPVSATWGGGRPGAKRAVTYQLPATVATEQLRLQPADLASPFGVLRVDRVGLVDGRLVERLELSPLG